MLCLHRPLLSLSHGCASPLQLAFLHPPQPQKLWPDLMPDRPQEHFWGHQRRRGRIRSAFVLHVVSKRDIKMPPKGTAAVKAKVTRLPPLPHLRVKTPNIANARPCNTVMASVLSTSFRTICAPTSSWMRA